MIDQEELLQELNELKLEKFIRDRESMRDGFHIRQHQYDDEKSYKYDIDGCSNGVTFHECFFDAWQCMQKNIMNPQYQIYELIRNKDDEVLFKTSFSMKGFIYLITIGDGAEYGEERDLEEERYYKYADIEEK